MIKKRDEILFFGILVGLVVLIIPLILALAQVRTPNGNLEFTNANEDVSTIYNFSINFTDSTPLNVTQINITLPSGFTFTSNTNKSLGTALHSGMNITFTNTSTVLSWANTTHYLFNGTNLSITSFLFNVTAANPGTFNFTIKVIYNATNYTTFSDLNVTINDTTSPQIQTANFSSPVIGGNYSGTLVLNASVYDNGVGGRISLFNFTITNSTGNVNGTRSASNISENLYYNASVNTALYTDGTYNISVWVNDSNGNLNSTTIISNVRFDNTAPTVTLSSSSATKTSLTLSIAVTDPTSGPKTCTSDRDSTQKVTITGVGTATQTLVETGLDCSTTYTYVATCNDYTGNSRSSSATSFTTSTCSGGGSSSGGSSGGTTTTWTNTFAPTVEVLTEGYTKELKSQERVKVMVGSTTHHVGVKSLTTSSAVIEIASDPVSVNLAVGEDAKIDVDKNGTYDIYVKLNAITSGKANVTIKSISETIPEGEGAVSTTGEVQETPTTEGETETGESNLTWLWIVIGIVIVLAIIGVSVKKRK